MRSGRSDHDVADAIVCAASVTPRSLSESELSDSERRVRVRIDDCDWGVDGARRREAIEGTASGFEPAIPDPAPNCELIFPFPPVFE